jgi:hypothetical protein
MKRNLTILIAILVIAGVAAIELARTKKAIAPSNQSAQDSSPTPTPSQTVQTKEIIAPIGNADARVTKKPFGIYITPADSPVSPERFTGYHTGTDFEILPGEENSKVPFNAICTGKILQKRTASGYGGVLVQSCTYQNQPITVVYGHIELASITKGVGDSLAQNEQIGYLGQPPSETDGERKHLHLGIHKGSAVNIAGYVTKQSDLSGWLDFQTL